MQSFEEEKEHLWITIRQLKSRHHLPAIRQARQLLRDWLRDHPEDLASRDAGEELAMMEEALTLLEAEKAAEPVAA
jgi:hypothetical protein